ASGATALSRAAGGFRDVTRFALSEPGWGTDILTENREPLSRLLRRLSDELEQWAARVETADRSGVARRLETARDTRKSLAPPVAAAKVLLAARPGEIARGGHALAEAGVDVRDRQLRHATQGGAGVLTLSGKPRPEERLASE